MKKILTFILSLWLVLPGAVAYADTTVVGAGTGWTTQTDCSTTTADSSGCWDSDNNVFYIGTGSVALAIGGTGYGGDVTGAGDCTGGACYDGSSDGGTYIRLYDGNSHYTELVAGDSSANLQFKFPTAYAAQNLTPILMSSAGVLSAATYSLPAADCNEGEILKADGSGNMVCSATLGLPPSSCLLPMPILGLQLARYDMILL